MAKRGGGDGEKVLLGIVGVALLAWLLSGRGKQNSPLIPDAIENQLDRAVNALNGKFGHRWVTHGLDALQTYLQRVFPVSAAVLNAMFFVERNYAHLPGSTKKQLALSKLRT